MAGPTKGAARKAPGLPPLLGWFGMLPCLAGLLAVTLLWRQSAGNVVMVSGSK